MSDNVIKHPAHEAEYCPDCDTYVAESPQAFIVGEVMPHLQAFLKNKPGVHLAVDETDSQLIITLTNFEARPHEE